MEQTTAIEKVQTSAMTFAEIVQGMEVTTDVEYSDAGRTLKQIKELLRQIGDVFDPIIQAAHAAHKAAVGKKKDAEAPLVDADRLLRDRMAAYHREQERIARAEQARLEAEARKAEEDRRVAMAELAEQSGSPELAEQIIDEQPVQIYVPQRAAPQAAGIHTRKNWTYRIYNVDIIPRAYMVPDTSKLSAVARAMKEQTNIPGVEVYCERGITVR